MLHLKYKKSSVFSLYSSTKSNTFVFLHIIPKSAVNILMSEVQIIMDAYQNLYK